MTVPTRYSRASNQFEAIMRDAQRNMDTATRHQTYQGVYGTLIVFRRRLTTQQVVDFAAILPAVLSAIFVSDWDTSIPPRSFLGAEAMSEEVQSVRRNHNSAPATVIQDVAKAVRLHVDPIAFQQYLAEIGPEAEAFWKVDS